MTLRDEFSQVAGSVPFDNTSNLFVSDNVQDALQEVSNILQANAIKNYNVISSTAFSTTSTTYVQITNFSIVPESGLYACWYNASILYTTTPISHYWAFFRDNTLIADSEREQITSRSNQTMVDSTMSIISFNGSQNINVRVRRGTSGVYTTNARSMILIRLGDAI